MNMEVSPDKDFAYVLARLNAKGYKKIASLTSLIIPNNQDRFAELPMNGLDVFMMGTDHSGVVDPKTGLLDHYLQQLLHVGTDNNYLHFVPIDQPAPDHSGANNQWCINTLYASELEATDINLRADRPNLKKLFTFLKMTMLMPPSDARNKSRLDYYSLVGFRSSVLDGNWTEQNPTGPTPEQVLIFNVANPNMTSSSFQGFYQKRATNSPLTTGGFNGFTVSARSGSFPIAFSLLIDDSGYYLLGRAWCRGCRRRSTARRRLCRHLCRRRHRRHGLHRRPYRAAALPSLAVR
jgi:hypothetical protein